MKKILLSLVVLAVLGVTAKVQGQCNLFPNNLIVNLTSANVVNGNCVIIADISFDIYHNNGNKKIWINLWKAADYAALPMTSGHPSYLDNDMPTLNDLDGPFGLNDPVAIIGINNEVTPVVYFTTYSADPSNITPTTGTSITKTVGPVINGQATDHFVLTGLSFTAPGLCNGLILQGDIWSSQASGNSPTIHCYANGISFFGDPTVNGGIFCFNPRQAVVILSTVNAAPMTVQYTVYVDQGVIGTLEPGDLLAKTVSGPHVISNGSPYNSGPFTYTGNDVQPWADRPLLVVVDVLAPFTRTTYGNIFNSCIPLPVQFNAFTATRSNQSNVVLKWSTIWEQNSKGFAVERNTNGTWQQVAYVPTQAVGGNSSDLLNYQHIDANNTKGISQYRIQQVDLDGRSKYSEVRSVRGESNVGQIIVFPNPSSDGKVNVSFENAAVRDLTVSDMSGRVIRQIKGYSNNSITIENLTPGMYTLRVVDPGTGEQAVTKIVVNKR